MILLNENVEHISFGFGVITEVKDNKISVQFQEEIGNKIFLYPDAFEKFLKAVKPDVENNILEELHKKQERLEMERIKREQEIAELEEKRIKAIPARRRTTKVKA